MNTTTSNHDTSTSPNFGILDIGAAAFNNIVGLPLNVYVLWLIMAGTRETLASDFFFLNVAMSQIFFALSSIWFFVFVKLNVFWSLKAYLFSRGLFYTAQPLFLCCICVEFYVGVVHPVLFLRFKPLRYRVGCCCVIWLITLVYCFCLLYFTDPLYLFAIFIQFILIYSIIIFCCCSVLRALKRPGPGEKITEKKKSNRMKRRAFTIILFIMISLGINYFFTWL